VHNVTLRSAIETLQ